MASHPRCKESECTAYLTQVALGRTRWDDGDSLQKFGNLKGVPYGESLLYFIELQDVLGHACGQAPLAVSESRL